MKRFLDMTPDEQRAHLAAEKAKVPAEAVEDFLDTWAKATANYQGSGMRLLGRIPGIGDISHHRHATELIENKGVTARPVKPSQMAEIRDAIRGGQVSIVLQPSMLLGATAFDAIDLHTAHGRFEPFEYQFVPAETLRRQASQIEAYDDGPTQ